MNEIIAENKPPDTLVTNIQRYAIHDGGGIRTAVFFKGCPLSCAWCHNPETMSYQPETALYHSEEGDRAENLGKAYTPAGLAKILLRDRLFYGVSGGGVTLSGGEPLARDMGYLEKLLRILHREGISVAIDTCGDVPWEHFQAAIPYTGLFLYDLKSASGKLHKKYTGRDNERIIENLGKLAPLANVWLRVPVIGGVNDGAEMAEIIRVAKEKAPGRKVSLLPYHNTGTHKWERLGKTPPEYEFHTPLDETMNKIKTEWENAGFHAEIGG